MVAAEDINWTDEVRVARQLFAFRILAAVILLVGVALAWRTNTPYWIDRSGKLLVAASLFLTYLQFRFEGGMKVRTDAALQIVRDMAEQKALPTLERQAALEAATSTLHRRGESLRHKVLVNALLMAGMGEVIAALGGFLFSMTVGSTAH